MGAYAAAADVEAEFKSISFSGSGAQVTTTEVNEWIDQAEAEINGRIAARYSVPVSGSESLKILKQITIWLCADRVKDVMEMKKVSTEELKQDVRVPGLYEKAKKMLKDIVSGELLLSDADLANAHQGISSFATSLDEPHQFKKGEDQW